jgi:cytoskeletal protein CcmA (bactofilin family)
MWKRDESDRSSTASRDVVAGKEPGDRKPSDKVIMDLGKSVVIKGELSASEDLTIYGQMEGKITLPGHTLTIGPHADIKAGIAAKTVVIIGAVTGNVTAGERIVIQPTGSVIGDVISPRLAIAEGGCLSGKVQMPDPRP